MKKVILTPNPYRDKNFNTVRAALEVLKSTGIEVKVCLPFDVEKTYDLPKDIHFYRLDKELPGASCVICFGGDGTILHMAKAATRQGVPILGVNIGTMGFMAELESTDDLIIVIAEQGHTDLIMDAARAAGAYGGTVIHAKGTGMEAAEKFMGVSIAAEKELVFIVTKSDEKNKIMQAIMTEAGLDSKAKAICFSLPVTDTAGLRLLED